MDITFEQIDTLLAEYEALTGDDVSAFIQGWVERLNEVEK